MVSLSRDTPSWAMDSWTRSQPNFPRNEKFYFKFYLFLLSFFLSQLDRISTINSLLSRICRNIITYYIIYYTIIIVRFLSIEVAIVSRKARMHWWRLSSGLEKWRKGALSESEWPVGLIGRRRQARERERESHVLVNLSQLFKRSW